MVRSKESAGGGKAESGKQAEGKVGTKGEGLTSAGRAVGQKLLHDETRLGRLLAVQEEAEKTIEEEEGEIERIRARFNSPFKMKLRDRQNCHDEIAERKKRVDMAREQWGACKAEMGKELRRLKAESEVEMKVHERDVAEKSRQIEACREYIRDIEETQKKRGYEG